MNQTTRTPPISEHITRAPMWQIVITQARYCGAYEGGEWLAVVDQHQTFLLSTAFADGHECYEYFKSEAADRVGRGETPNAALDDLNRRWWDAGRPDHYSWEGDDT